MIKKKQWKVLTRNKIHTIYSNKEKGISVDVFKKIPEVEIIKDEKRVVLKSFKSKRKAFKFAKEYMKKH